jgi:transposase, IS5 family
MTHQTTFAHAEFAAKKKTTRREKFLARMEEVIPWAKLLAVIEPHYPKGKRGRPPIGLERMLRVYFLQQWYGLADEALEDALYDSQALQHFATVQVMELAGEIELLGKIRNAVYEHWRNKNARKSPVEAKLRQARNGQR